MEYTFLKLIFSNYQPNNDYIIGNTPISIYELVLQLKIPILILRDQFKIDPDCTSFDLDLNSSLPEHITVVLQYMFSTSLLT